MKTILDEAHTWFLKGIAYRDGLNVTLAEGFRGTIPEDIRIGDRVIQNTFPIDVNENSRVICIRFDNPVAWEVILESFTTRDDYEQGDEGFLQVMQTSRYFDYVNKNHGWYVDVIGAAKHYRIWTENEVIEVVSCDSPSIEPWKSEAR